MTHLEKWIHGKIFSKSPALTRYDIERYQLEKLKETIDWCREKSPFYRRHLKSITGESLDGLKDLSRLPFTVPDDITENDLQFLCVSRDDIKRVVTLQTSGTSGNPKRLYFTREDLNLSIDFFAHAMPAFVRPGGKVMILLPGGKPDSVGDLIARGLSVFGAEGIIHGPVLDPQNAAREIVLHRPECIIGIPTQVFWLAGTGRVPPGIIENIILTTDYVPEAIIRVVEKSWQCRVFNHYGMTEMGLGGGVECGARDGYHLREADLYLEIVDPETGLQKNDGEAGEIVFTTLTRKGMPLIRYRTGDISSFMKETCGCKTVLKRLARVRGRLANQVVLGNEILCMADMDETLFSIPGLFNFKASVTHEKSKPFLHIKLFVSNEEKNDGILMLAEDALKRMPAIHNAMANSGLTMEIDFSRINWYTTGSEKRTL